MLFFGIRRELVIADGSGVICKWGIVVIFSIVDAVVPTRATDTKPHIIFAQIEF
ncbi:hypothetical protein D3C85_1795170 [compost metagenome]